MYRAFRESRDYGLKDQMTRAAVSVPSNIAEGHERASAKEFVRFLNIAKGSLAELRTQLYIAQKIGAIETKAASGMIGECKELGAMIHALSKSRKSEIAEMLDSDGQIAEP